MKTFPRLSKCLAFATAAFALMAISECDRKHNVIFLPDIQHPDQILIPGTEIEAADAASLTKLLRASDDRFYLIQPYENGVPGRVFGSLGRIHMSKAMEAESSNKTSGTTFSRWTRVIGQGCYSRCTQRGGQRRGRRTKEASHELVQRVAPILRKYAKE
jgi:hypothetical protein